MREMIGRWLRQLRMTSDAIDHAPRGSCAVCATAVGDNETLCPGCGPGGW